MQILSLICEYLTAGGLFCSISFYRQNFLPLDTLLPKYFTAGLFLYCSMLFIVLTCLLQEVFLGHLITLVNPILGLRYTKRANSSKTSPIAFGPCFKPIIEFWFRLTTQHKSHLLEGKLFPRQLSFSRSSSVHFMVKMMQSFMSTQAEHGLLLDTLLEDMTGLLIQSHQLRSSLFPTPPPSPSNRLFIFQNI